MLNTSEWPNDADVCLLSQQLAPDSVRPEDYLKPKACRGLLRRAEKRGRELPQMLKVVLEMQARSECAPGNQGGGKGALIGDEISNTLQTGNDQTLVYYGIGNGQSAEACDMQEELSQTLNCMHDRQAVMCVDKHLCKSFELAPALEKEGTHELTVAAFMGGQGAKAGSIAYSEEVAPTIKAAESGTNQVPDVVCYEFNPTDARIKETDISPTVLSRWGTGGNQVPFTAQFGFVRRLTTVECARLQGFPDHHTEIPWKKKPASQCPKGPQYKAYGNSMCVNVIEWLGKRIARKIANPQPIKIYQPEQMEFDF